MRIILQRCEKAEVFVGTEEKGNLTSTGKIGQGLVVLLGVEDDDDEEDLSYLLKKTTNLRIFSDDEGKMNWSLQDIGGDIAVVSQFTLHAKTKKGNRPSFVRAGSPENAEKFYQRFVDKVTANIKGRVISGKFGAYMKIDFVNDGPVTIFMDSKNRNF